VHFCNSLLLLFFVFVFDLYDDDNDLLNLDIYAYRLCAGGSTPFSSDSFENSM